MSQPSSLAEGRYTLTDPLGQGGMASVFRCYDHRLQVWRAAKLLEPSLARRKSIRARFTREAHAMARLEHRHVVRVYDVGTDDDVPWMVMELAEGGSLVDWVEKHGAMPARLAAEVMVAVCDGVQAAHDEGIVHRDIKPDNVLLDRRGVCKVTDFGIAREMDDLNTTKTGTVMGTWLFMAPEQRADAKHIDHRADVYALGATLAALLLGEPPADLFAVAQDPSKLEGVPSLLRPVIERAVAYMPADRFGSAREMQEVLQKLLPALPQAADVPPLVVRRPPSKPPPAPLQTSPPASHGPTAVATTSASSTGADSAPPTSVDLDESPRPVPPRRRSEEGPAVGRAAVEAMSIEEVERALVARGHELPQNLPSYVDRDSLLRNQLIEDGFVTTEEALARGLSLGPEAERRETDDDEDNEDGIDRGFAAQAGWAFREVMNFIFQILKAVAKALRSPLGAFGLPLLGLLVIGSVPVVLGTFNVRSAAVAADSAKAGLFAAIERDAAVVADLRTLQGRHELLSAQLDAMRNGPDAEARLNNAILFVVTVDQDVTQKAVNVPRALEHKAVMAQQRRDRLNRAAEAYSDAMLAWEEAADSATGRAAVEVGAAPMP